MPDYATIFRSRADDYLKLAAETIDPQDQVEWINLARECLTLLAGAENDPHIKDALVADHGLAGIAD